MPQGRRKLPFSGKQKKIQLQQRRERRRPSLERESKPSNAGHGAQEKDTHHSHSEDEEAEEVKNELDSKAVKKHHILDSQRDYNRYRLLFKTETEEELRRNKEKARQPLNALPEDALEVSYEDIYAPGSELDMPKRPPWDYSLSKQQLEAQEHKYFREYLDKLESRFKGMDLNYFDLNLETWRQLWRVLEMSDIILLIVDIRHPVLHFSPALYDHVTKDMKKDIILVLNKIDLAPAPLVIAWQHYFKQHFPKLHILPFAAYAGMRGKMSRTGRRKGKLHMAANGAKRLLHICEEIVADEVDLTSWHCKIDEELIETQQQKHDDNEEENDYDIEELDDEDDDDLHPLASAVLEVKNDTSPYQADRFMDGILTIGCVGHPNVGKSALLNSLMGKKVVSVSRTPGHTKHFQTIFLTPIVRLCDCPGLIFPSLVPKPMQVLMGCYPISQLREPYTSVGYLAERIPVQNILKLIHPDQEGSIPDPNLKWSAFDICEAWAKKKGFLTARAARLDVYRAANSLLRFTLDGHTLCLNFYPPGFFMEKDKWFSHPGVEEIEIIQGLRKQEKLEETLLPSFSEGDATGKLSSSGDEEEIKSGPLLSVNKYALLDESA